MITNDTSSPSFEQLFALYCDINEINFEDMALSGKSDRIIQTIIGQEYHAPITYCKYGFLFFYFDALVRGEITIEQFLTMGDIEGQVEDQINPHIYQEEHPVYLTSLTPEVVSSWTSDDFIIIDQNIHNYYVSQYGAVKSDAKILILD